jgi:hypothetical protein
MPSIAPASPDDLDIYLVLDDFGERLGRSWREVDEERTDREAVIQDLLDGQYSGPVRIVAFNTAERWSRDVSEEIADELSRRCAIEGRETTAALEGFLDRNGGGKPVQLPLPLRGQAPQRGGSCSL